MPDSVDDPGTATGTGPGSARGGRLEQDGVTVPTAGARAWAVVGAIGAVTAIWFVLPGVLGMVAGSVAHLKGDRWGMPVAVVAAITTIVGMALAFWVRG